MDECDWFFFLEGPIIFYRSLSGALLDVLSFLHTTYTNALCIHTQNRIKVNTLQAFGLTERNVVDTSSRGTMSYSEKQDGSISKDEWVAKLEEGFHMQRVSMNNLIMNYLVTEGFKEAAEKFQQESGVGPTVELSSLDDRIRIRDAIQNGRIQEATDLVNQLHPELLDNDRYLYFHLQQLHLIELIRTGRIEEALQFAQDQLSEAGESDDNILCELERTLALLAFDEPHKSPFSDLLHPTHRQKIASELNAAILKMEHRESTSPRLNNLLKMILWAQDELDKKKVKYPKMTDLGSATIENPK